MKHQKIDNFPLIAQEAFLYQPTFTDCKVGQAKKTRRFIFEGNVQYDSFEENILQEFDEYLLQESIQLDSFWDRAWKLRFIISAYYDFPRTVKEIQQYQAFRKENAVLKYTATVKKYINKGLLYFCGRDCKFRPILVFDVKKIVEENIKVEDMIQLVSYILLTSMNETFIGGIVQNWVVLIDVGYVSAFSLVGPLKTLIQFLSKFFKCRMYKTYLVRCSSSVSFSWNIGKKFLEQQVIDKINFLDGQCPTPLFEYANPHQIQQKFGGMRQNITKYWPIEFPKANFQSAKCPIDSISAEQYRKLYEKGKLHHPQIKKCLVQVQQKPKLIIKEVTLSKIIKDIQNEIIPKTPISLVPKRMPRRILVQSSTAQ